MASWTAEAVSAWAQLATLLVAVGAVIAAFVQVRANRSVTREAEAQESFRDYLRLLIENKGVDVPSGQNKREYHFLVVFMLSTFEKIFELSRGDEHWKTAMMIHILRHKTYLEELKQRELFYESFDPEFCSFVRETLLRESGAPVGGAV